MSIINKLFNKKEGVDLLKNKDFSASKESGGATRESGRTMTEMLGTLAIIGVLSIGGVAGYSYAMDKYRANVTINDINLRAIDLITQSGRELPLSLSEWSRTSAMGYTFSDPEWANDGSIALEISGLPERVCEMVVDTLGERFDIEVGATRYTGDNSICGEDNAVTVFFEKTGAGITCNPACGNGEVCDNGICVDEESQWVSIPDITCSSNADCPECWACSSSYCYDSWSLDGTSCGNGAGTCKSGVCYLNRCSSDSDCAGDEICGDAKSSCKNRTPGQCRKIKWQVKTITVGGVTERWYIAQQNMIWWDAESACKMVGTGHMATVNDLVSGWSGSDGTFTRTERAQKLYDAIGGYSYAYVWTSDIYYPSDSCEAFSVSLSSGNVNHYVPRNNGSFLALCRGSNSGYSPDDGWVTNEVTTAEVTGY